MSVHRSASSSGLLLQAVMTRVGKMSDNVNAAFLKDALAVIENVHKQFAGKLVSFLVNKYLIGPHLSLTRYEKFKIILKAFLNISEIRGLCLIK